MKSRPILFSAPMVRALLAGTKSQTRRIMKPQPVRLLGSGQRIYDDKDFKKSWAHVSGMTESLDPYVDCPYGRPGDRLWVRETWGYTRQCDDINGPGDVIAYAAGGEHVYENVGGKRRLRLTQRGKVMQPNHFCWPPKPWKPSTHMPRWASRITLEITGVRVERLQEISEADALAEGVDAGHDYPGCDGPRFNFTSDCKHGCGCWMGCTRSGGNDGVDPFGSCPKNPAVPKYRALWESINGPGSWDANPWVWVVEFKRVQP